MKIPTLAGTLRFSMRALRLMGEPPPTSIEVNDILLRALADELLIEPSEIMRIGFNGARFVVTHITPGEFYLR